MPVQRFKKDQRTVEAFEVTHDNHFIVQDWITANGGSVAARPVVGEPPRARALPMFYIWTIEGLEAVRPGDFVVREIDAGHVDFYPSDPYLFHELCVEAGPDLGCMTPKPKRKRVGPIAWLQIQIFKARTIGFEPEDFPQ